MGNKKLLTFLDEEAAKKPRELAAQVEQRK